MQLSPILLELDLQSRFGGPGHAGLLVAIAVADVHDPLPGVSSLDSWHWWREALGEYWANPSPEMAGQIWANACDRERVLSGL
jgi:hypothetical protein